MDPNEGLKTMNIDSRIPGVKIHDPDLAEMFGTAVSNLHEAAIDAAASGIPVFPCLPGTKRPATPHGFKDATTNRAQIDAWWHDNPSFNVGCSPGQCGWAVIDPEFDAAPDWANGEALPKTYTVKTPRGGKHLYFEGSLPSTTAKLAPRVDTRGRGGYVLLPPSVTEDGQYSIEDNSDPAPLPAWLAQWDAEHATQERKEAPALGNPVAEEHLRKLLGYIDPDAPRGDWRDAIAGIHATPLVDDPDASKRRQIAHEFSEGKLERLGRYKDRRPSRYTSPGDVDTVFDTMPPREGGVRYGTVFAMAKAAGYDGPPAQQSSAETFKDYKPDQAEAEAETGEQPSAKERSVGGTGSRELLRLNPQTPLLSAAHFLGRFYMARNGARHLQHYQGQFYIWTGSHYAAADDARMRSEIYPFLEAAFNGDKPFDPNTTKVNEVVNALKASAYLDSNTRAPAWIDNGEHIESMFYPAAELVACKNGLLHLPTRVLLPHTPHLFTFNALDFAYDPKAPAPAQWLRFLDTIWPDDGDAIGTLQEMFGYLVSGDLRQQKAFLIVGPKRAGKGTIARVITQLLGPDNVAGPTLAGLSQNFGLAPLIGKRAAIISDARLSDRADQHVIAERVLSISGEDSITVDRKHIAPWTGRLPVRFLILTNELPRLADASGALASRFVVLMLRQSFYGREDHSLAERLGAELPGILNWALAGWDRLNKRGHFEVPRSSASAIQQLEDLTSPVGAFVRERCEVGANLSVARDDLFSAWKFWCDVGGRPTGTRETFGRDLAAMVPGIESGQRRKGEERVRIYQGIGLGKH
jgi:putative DNA primase/helicase